MTTLRLLSAGAAKGFIWSLTSHAMTDGVIIDADFGPVGAMLERIKAGENFDVVVLSRSAVDELADADFLSGHRTASLGYVHAGVAVPLGIALPDIGDRASLAAAILAADDIYIGDAKRSTAGAHFAKVIVALGLDSTVGPRVREYPTGSAAMAALAEGGPRALGATQITEIAETPSVQLVGPLPGAFGLRTEYVAAVGQSAVVLPAAEAYMRLLGDPRSADLRREAGFQVA
jgi:molybdate transport system substrate-binding protein